MLRSLSFLALAASTALAGNLPWTSTPLSPPSAPLAVRTPYLSTWLPIGAGSALNDVWAQHWTGRITGWAGYVRVDGTVYTFLGAPAVPNQTPQKATQTDFEYTSTQTIFTLSAGPVDFTVTFLSPVEPDNLLRQSLPFSYMSIVAQSSDCQPHSVQVYSDISAEWAAGDVTLGVQWATNTTGPAITHSVQLQQQNNYNEVNDMILQGAAYYSLLNGNGVTYATGADVDIRGQFITNGKLDNSQDSNFRAANDNWPVFAFSQDLGDVSSTSDPVTFVVGHARDPAVLYVTAGNNQVPRSSFFFSEFATVDDALAMFHGDFQHAVSTANTFDAKVKSDAGKISDDYTAIVELSIRQALGATEITVGKNSDGSFNASDVLVFMKEISSDGNLNTVDVIFPAWPVLLYTNPLLGRFLLEGLFAYQATGLYPNPWAVHDLGAHYPQAIGHNDGNDEKMPVEESGNMVIMALSYAQRTNDTSQLAQYTDLLDGWTQFLIQDSLIPANQISTDDFAGPLANQTNLAIKGIIGIQAMAEIATLLGDADKAKNYSGIAQDYVQQWQGFAISSDGTHLKLAYQNDSSWGLSYNLFADRLLKTNLFPQSVYDMQTKFYPSVAQQYGVPLDTRHTYTKTDWQTWTATFMSNTSVRDVFIGGIAAFLNDNDNDAPFSDFYDTISGQDQGFRARPVAGGHLAFLVLDS